MEDFKLDSSNRFIISNFQHWRPFSNTLPGIAGLSGIPMWVFYVNRGQAITSFGVENKDHPLMEFQPANKAYQVTLFLGFRTFIKIIGANGQVIYEPFAAGSQSREQQMIISLNELELQERHPARGLQVEVLYFILPEERLAGLVRQVKITNLAERPAELEILDGLPVLIPYGVTNTYLKEIHRTIEAWMEIYNQEQNIPFFRLHSSPGDSAEVRPILGGNFAMATAFKDGGAHPLAALVNPEMVFGQNTSLSFPDKFQQHPLAELFYLPQVAGGKTPCALFGYTAKLAPNESVTLTSVFGHASKLEVLNQVAPRLRSEDYLHTKRQVAQELVTDLTVPIATKTGLPVFDAYVRQTFLDNVLRGGWPVHLDRLGKPVTYHVYSRKHGDPERDYNAFYLAAEYYSQGNGNYRDVNQNRRSEVLFDPRVEDTDIRSFMSLIQADGYNPLVVKGSRFWIPPDKQAAILKLAAQPEKLQPLLEKPFTPGGLLTGIDNNEIDLLISPTDFLALVLHETEQIFDAKFGEGYWTDHWIYNLDLIDSFLAVYPDRSADLLFGREDLPFFDSSAVVQPRSKKYVLVGELPRQMDAVFWDANKSALISTRTEYPHWMRDQKGRGKILCTTLFARLILLGLIKFSTLDPLGMGVEMEAGKPGWCDALNGLPGLFGSSLSETFELRRLLTFLIEHLPEGKVGTLRLPVEVVELLHNVVGCLRIYQTSEKPECEFEYWNAVSTARETYREKIRLGFDGETEEIPIPKLAEYLSLFLEKVQAGITRATQKNGGIPPSYFYYEVEAFEILKGPEEEQLKDEKGRPHIRVLRFRQKVLPLFLEGAVRMFKTLPDSRSARQVYRQVKRSELYDPVLKMYKTNEPLESQPMEIGRLRAFTPGWLENESIFLHMEYKYLLELLRAGLYQEFFEDFRNALVAFQDPARYGRSPLENSSFIVSSAHPDRSLHGAGFVARLTGATAEFLSMWNLMLVGQNPFFIENGELCLRFRPALPAWLFDEDGALSFTFLGRCQVAYFNPLRQNTFTGKMHIQTMNLYLDGEQIEVQGNVIRSPTSSLVREGRIRRIDIFFSGA
jgi:hypothetical protein